MGVVSLVYDIHSLANRHSSSTLAETRDRKCVSMQLIFKDGRVPAFIGLLYLTQPQPAKGSAAGSRAALLILVVGKVDMINQICQMLSFC